MIGIIGCLDLLTGYELSLSIFYVIPIAFLTWFIDSKIGILSAVISAYLCCWTDVAAGHPYSHPFVVVWDFFVKLAFFLIIISLLSRINTDIKRERELARTDNLTGAGNSRCFFESIQIELDRLQRYQHPFTFAYLDLDNFKLINDRFGHATGDRVLCTVVNYVKNHLRKTDRIVRLGGDEFALLLPETDQESARLILPRLQNGLSAEMQQNGWPITSSVGVLTYYTAPGTIDELVRLADELMYAVKREGKNAIKYSTYI